MCLDWCANTLMQLHSCKFSHVPQMNLLKVFKTPLCTLVHTPAYYQLSAAHYLTEASWFMSSVTPLRHNLQSVSQTDSVTKSKLLTKRRLSGLRWVISVSMNGMFASVHMCHQVSFQISEVQSWSRSCQFLEIAQHRRRWSRPFTYVNAPLQTLTFSVNLIRLKLYKCHMWNSWGKHVI